MNDPVSLPPAALDPTDAPPLPGGVAAKGPTLVAPETTFLDPEDPLVVDTASPATGTPAPSPAPAPPPASPPARRPVVAPLRPGDRIGRFLLDKIIGDGATATVWSAHHETLGTPVAIKVFHEHHSDFARVLGEARAAAGIPSPHVVWVHDVGDYDGHPAIIMELSGDPSGATAASLREAPPATLHEAVRLAAQIARGVAAAHAGHVFHKDLKPANILRHPVDGRAQITDFGLANPELWRMLERTPRRPAQSTVYVDDMVVAPLDAADPHAIIRGPVRVGTPEFMAPEQAQGLRHDLDAQDATQRRYLTAIDIYGIGATLFAMIADKPPFPLALGEEATSDPRLIMTEVAAHPAPTLRQVPTRFRVPKRLERLVAKAMAFEPMDRHPSAEALADDLEAWLAGRPTSVDRGPLARLAVHAWRERFRTVLPAAALLLTFGVLTYNSQLIYEQRVQVADLQSQSDRLRNNNQRVRAELGETRHDLATSQKTLDEAQAALNQSTTQLQRKNLDLRQAKALLDLREAELVELTADLENNAATMEALQARLETVSAELDQAQAALSLARDEAEEATQRYLASDALLHDLRQDLQTSEQQRVQATASTEALQAQVAALQLSEQRLSTELATKNDDLTKARRRLQLARDEAVTLREKLVSAQGAGQAGSLLVEPVPQ